MSRKSTGIGDPAGLIAHLWMPPTSNAGRTGLTVAKVTAAAVELADAEGLEALTMRRIADTLGVGTMSLYGHVIGKPQLVELMCDLVAGRLYSGSDLPGSAATWQAGVRQIADRNWEHLISHRWLAELAPGRPVPGPGATGKYEIELAPLDGIGLTDVQMDLTLGNLLGLVESAARWQIGLDRLRAASGVGDADWWEQVGPLLATAMSGHHFPLAGRVGAAAGEHYQASGNPLEQLRFGVDRLIDGIAELIGTIGPR
ncbi:TetR/AcrR family transcriptional regulator [Nakamurella lactea]|uniref:TetR/AcrR family transcriptional regulator n=1 Tax=Nakamurella lactea TaxID=459515 RepID=UPI00041E4C1F|nr:TetR/AcrR family transcriptional regulator C-terminal domain-containing protein [Nakamurella lactea]